MFKKLKFIDLFAGIGGIRLGFERAGCECVFSSEIDRHACEMYEANYGDNPYCDITKLDANDIPDFDILCAGFPCQSFSICGRQKGFYDEIRGTLFFDICRLLEAKKPSAFMLENVFNLEKHDKGKTLSVMLDALNSLGYSVSYNVLNARDFGVPQNRERIIIVGNKKGRFFDFKKLQKNRISSMQGFLDKDGVFEILSPDSYTILDNSLIKTQNKSGLRFCGYRNKKIRTTGVRPGTEHLSRVHKQPNRIYDADGTHPTLASQEFSGRYFIKVGDTVRKLTMNECYRFMGFPNNFKRIGTDAQLYARIGNSVCVPMIEAVANQIVKQLFTEGVYDMNSTNTFLEKTYQEAITLKSLSSLNLSNEQLSRLDVIAQKEETFKGVFTVLFTSLTYKALHPNQDVRRHQANMYGGYSGRSFDTKYITPFLKQKRFLGAMKESGWLTRSLEQNIPYGLDFPGKIQSKQVKDAFLKTLHDVEENGVDATSLLKGLIYYSNKYKGDKNVILINPIEKETKITIEEIISALKQHFYFKYKSRGASILPVIALYSIYECITDELRRFDGMTLDEKESHNSSDRSSGETGDIVVRDANGEIYEVVEVKFEIAVDSIMIEDAYKKIANKPVQRYYILSTKTPCEDELVKMNEIISRIREEHGCQVIVNGLIPTMKYYLRLLDDTDKFVSNYIKNLSNDTEINYEHKIAWNTIMNA
ncbi:MAG: DNA (cytosine-5-)-methyltransferase [Ruminococcaceae bacterium]|nr:DNA (cytosine-5-)-methyltransferase [Oscillospiraceae bacterium]